MVMAKAKKNRHIGSRFDDFLVEEGIAAETNALAIKRVIALQLRQYMEETDTTKTDMAALMSTSRAALDRLLDPDNPSVTLQTLDRAATALGKRLKLELVEAA